MATTTHPPLLPLRMEAAATADGLFRFGRYFRLRRGGVEPAAAAAATAGSSAAVEEYGVPEILVGGGDGDGEEVSRLVPREVVQRGAYGVLVRYAGARGEEYAVKIEDARVSARGEHPVLVRLAGVDCGQIHGRPVGFAPYLRDGGTYDGVFSLLELMDGDLRHETVLREYAEFWGLAGRREAALHVAEDVRQQVVCLFRHDPTLVYADLKPANVMFKRGRAGEVRIRLGDLGSMMMRRGDEYAMSFPCPPRFAMRRFDTAEEAAACLAYQVGMLLASLLGMPRLHYLGFARVEGERRARRGRRLVPKLREAVRDHITRALPLYDPAVADLLHLDPRRRRSVFLPLVEAAPAWLSADEATDADHHHRRGGDRAATRRHK